MALATYWLAMSRTGLALMVPVSAVLICALDVASWRLSADCNDATDERCQMASQRSVGGK